MSTTTVGKNSIPQTISKRLQKLRATLSRFILVEGLSKVLGVLLLILLADVVLDRLFKMDVAQRGIMLAVMIGVVLATVVFRLLKPFTKKVSDDALILQVESKNQELKESMISAAQFARGGNYEQQGYSQSMVDATIKHGSQMAEKVTFGKAIDGQAFTRNVSLLMLSLAGLGAIGYGVAKTDFWRTWFNRNILLSNDQWPRKTVLVIDGATDGKMILLRGEDHKQVVRVDNESKVTDVDVSIEFDDGSVKTKQKMRQTGTLEHTLVFRNVSSPFRFRAIGGDDKTEWIDVDLVDAPDWSQLEMVVDLPDYTGVETHRLPPGGGPHSILKGSSLSISGKANKGLSAAGLKVGEVTWDLENTDGDSWSLNIPAEKLVGGKYTFDLADEMGLRSSRPTTFSVRVKPDRAPSVRATLVGISGLVVPRARIPMSYTAGDEFSVTQMRLEHSWSGKSADSVAQTGSKNLTDCDPDLAKLLGQSEIRSVAVADLEPLKIPIETSLRLRIAADDNNTLTGPGTSFHEFLLQVVSEEKLRGDLLRREIEQRKAFELVIGNQEKLTYDLQAIADDAAKEPSELDANEAVDRVRDVQRRQKLIGTNVSRVADRFQSFLAEAINNRLDEAESEIERSQSIEERFGERIIKPIRALDANQIIRAGQLIELAQRSIVGDQVDPAALQSTIADSIDKQNEIIDQMKEILAAMKDSETYQEIVNKVIEIKRTEERIRDKAREKRDEAGGDGIFDDDADGMFDDEEVPEENPTEGSEDKKDGGNG